MGKKNSAPPPPNYGPLIAATKDLMANAQQLATDQFEWAKSTYAEDKAVTDKVVASFLETQQQARDQALADRARYEQVFQPVEDAFVKDAMSYDDPARLEEERTRAQAQVSSQFDAARDSARQTLESYGINPSATRYGALDIGVRTAEAAASAQAGNQAVRAREDAARDYRAQAVQLGQTYPDRIAQSYNTAAAAGAGAAGATATKTATGAETMGTPVQYSGVATNALNGWTSALNSQYNAQMAKWKADQESSSGIGQLIGTVIGMGTKAFGFEDGGVVPEPEKAAGAIPMEASPSRGAIPDDVPVNLTGGEFIMPREAVTWFGEKHLLGMLEKANRERQEARAATGATPKPAPATAPAQALPV